MDLLPSEHLKEEAYQNLLIPSYRKWLNEQNTFEGLILFAHLRNTGPISLLVAENHPPSNLCHVQSLYVEPPYRNQGLGSELMKALNPSLSLETIYPDTAVPFSHILHRQKWQPPKSLLIRLFFYLPHFNPSWFDHPLPPGHSLIPYSQLTSEEKEDLAQREMSGHFGEDMSPLQDSRHVEHLNTLFLKAGGHIIGWSLTHSHPPFINYTALYIDKPYRSTGLSIALLQNSIRLQKYSSNPWATFEYNPARIPPSWLSFIVRRLAPLAHHQITLLHAFKPSKDVGA